MLWKWFAEQLWQVDLKFVSFSGIIPLKSEVGGDGYLFIQ